MRAIWEYSGGDKKPSSRPSPKGRRGSKQQGFTLIELSIVLVIIGLIIGGVLVGRELIAGAELRATVSQLEKYNTATTTFRLKYNQLPGDIPPAKAAQFGFFTITNNCGGVCGFSNGLIDQGGVDGSSYTLEFHVFWQHLSQARLVEGDLRSNLLLTSTGGPIDPAYRDGVLLKVKYIPVNYWWISINGYEKNEFTMLDQSITPTQAYALDSKIDDGIPNTGKIIDTLYNLSAANGADTNACTIHIDAGF